MGLKNIKAKISHEISCSVRSIVSYLPPPEGAGEFMACTISVVRASNKLVMKSTFFPSGQPSTNQRQKVHQNYLPPVIWAIMAQWSWSASKAWTPVNQHDRSQTENVCYVLKKCMQSLSRAWRQSVSVTWLTTKCKWIVTAWTYF